MNRMAFAARAASKMRSRFFSVSPIYLLTTAGELDLVEIEAELACDHARGHGLAGARRSGEQHLQAGADGDPAREPPLLVDDVPVADGGGEPLDAGACRRRQDEIVPVVLRNDFQRELADPVIGLLPGGRDHRVGIDPWHVGKRRQIARGRNRVLDLSGREQQPVGEPAPIGVRQVDAGAAERAFPQRQTLGIAVLVQANDEDAPRAQQLAPIAVRVAGGEDRRGLPQQRLDETPHVGGRLIADVAAGVQAVQVEAGRLQAAMERQCRYEAGHRFRLVARRIEVDLQHRNAESAADRGGGGAAPRSALADERDRRGVGRSQQRRQTPDQRRALRIRRHIVRFMRRRDLDDTAQARIRERQAQQELRHHGRQRKARIEQGRPRRGRLDALQNARLGEPSRWRERGGDRRPARRIMPEQALRQVERRPFACHVVVEIRVERLVFEINLGREREQDQIEIERLQGKARGELTPSGRTVGYGDKQPARGGRCGEELAVRLGCRPAHHAIDLFVAHIESAEFVERELIARAQAHDFALEQTIEPRQRQVHMV